MHHELARLFDHPDPAFSPAPLWWWSGEKVTAARLLRQMELLARGGVHNVVVINLAPAGPVAGAPADDPLWFEEEWWKLFEAVCAAGRRLGTRVFFYDQIGFSGANLQGRLTLRRPEFAGAALRRTLVPCAPDGRVSPPPDATPVAAFTAGGRRLVLDGDRVYGAGGDEVVLVHTVPTAYDYLSPEACAALFDLVHGEFERRVPDCLGTVVAGSFQDELPMHNSWTPRFPEEFAKRHGYDLMDVLPALWDPAADESAKVLGDYYRTRAALAEEAFFRPLGQWHARHGMLLGSDQLHPARGGHPVQSTQFYSDYFRTHRWYGAAGSDHEGDTKVHSSLAHLYGHERVWVESFHSSGWGGTLEDTYDWLLPFFQAGGTLYNPHAVHYSTVGGWFEWAPPSTDWRQPYWGQYRAFADAVSRICGTLSWGVPVCDVAVLYPSATVQARLPLDAPVRHFEADDPGPGFGALSALQREYLGLVGQNNWFRHRPGALREAGLEYTIVDEASLQRASAEADGSMTIGALRFGRLVLPGCAVLETETARTLLGLLRQGTRVVLLGEAPRLAAGRGGDDALVARVAAHPGVVSARDAGELVRLLAGGDRPVRAPVPVLARALDGEGVAFVPAASPNASGHPLRTEGWWWQDFDFDPKRYMDSLTLTLRGTPDCVELWNPATGTRRTARFTRGEDATRVEVDFDGAPAQLVVWGARPSARLAPSAAPPSRVRTVEGPWTGTLLPTLGAADDAGDLVRPAGSEPPVQIWEFTAAEGERPPGGEDGWTRAHATFGPRGLVAGPAAPEALPSALTPEEATRLAAGRRACGGEDAWRPVEYSDSRGVRKDPRHTLGPKGRVPEEFLAFPGPGAGEAVHYRTVVGTTAPGPCELVVGAGATKEVWWNGVRSETSREAGYLVRLPVEARDRNVLELRLGGWAAARGLTGFHEPTLDVFWTLAAPGSFPDRPEFLTTAAPAASGDVRFVREFDVPGVPGGARLMAGAAAGLSLRLNGVPVARQARVEYYVGADWGARPSFFLHDLKDALRPGANTLEAVLHTTAPGDVVMVDLAVDHTGPDGERATTLVVSDTTWHSVVDGRRWPVRPHAGQWGEPAASHVRRRPHPLQRTAWLNGPPQAGSPTLPVEAAPDGGDPRQWFRLTLPAGTVTAALPVRGEAAAVHAETGAHLPLRGGRLVLDRPAPAPLPVLLRVDGAGLARGGAAWEGPVEVATVPVEVSLGTWHALGLTSWSGGLEYRTRVRLTPAEAACRIRLNLGDLRGSAQVLVNGREAGHLFCRPWAVEAGALLHAGGNDIAVRLYNTLGPYLDAVSPTTFVWPSQRVSGLFGPVTLELTPTEPAAP